MAQQKTARESEIEKFIAQESWRGYPGKSGWLQIESGRQDNVDRL